MGHSIKPHYAALGFANGSFGIDFLSQHMFLCIDFTQIHFVLCTSGAVLAGDRAIDDRVELSSLVSALHYKNHMKMSLSACFVLSCKQERIMLTGVLW